MILFIVLLFSGIFLTLALHELSHVLVAKICGLKHIEFKLYPHKFNNRWVMGRTSALIDPQDPNLPFIHSSPLWKSFILFLVWICVGGYLYWPFFALAIWELSDYIWWWVGFLLRRSESDGKKMREWLDNGLLR